MIQLRPYQTDVVNAIYQHWQQGGKYVCGVMPTGAGKSVCMGKIEADHRGKSCVIAHRQELVSQLSLHLAKWGVYHRLIASKNVIRSIISEHRIEFGRSYYNPQAPAAVASVDTLIARKDSLSSWAQQVTLWLQDEAHHLLRENKWGRAAEMFPNAVGLGVTATPQRADGKGLGAHADGVFEALVVGPSMRELIEMGSLCDYDIVAPPSDFNREELRAGTTGDFSFKQMAEASRKSHIVGDVVESYLKFARGKKGVTFTTDVETATMMALRYQANGIPAEAISAKTPDHVRSEFIRRLRSGDLLQLVNVDLIGEGFDLPALEVVSMARPTESFAVYAQQFGRALRPSEGKERGLIIDHVSNVVRHNVPDVPRQWTLDARDKRSRRPSEDIIQLTTCTSCYHLYERYKTACPRCGFAPEPEQRGRPEQVDGDLELLDRAVLEQMRKAIILESPGDMAERVGHVAGAAAAKARANSQRGRIDAQKRLADVIAKWAGVQRHKGLSDREIHKAFYLGYKIDVLTALSGTTKEMDTLAGRIEQ